MNVLRFKKGYKNWDATYEAELDYEYTTQSIKKITTLIVRKPDTGKSFAIPWNVVEEYLQGHRDSSFVDEAGNKLKYVQGMFQITGSNFNLIIHPDQIASIRIAAKNIVKGVSHSVENIFREHSTQRY
jgi:hypothetical protein